ncbi:MAG: helix-turn-helix domain-containing protein [Bradyrhizobium sp.]|nr:helix-turn-helix domain-containing protein [Bradyrhizobium sp.]
MNSVRFSTLEVAKPRQLERWRSWYADSFEVTALDAPDRGFAAESEVWKLDGMALVSVSAPPLRATRPKSLIRRDPTDHWVITVGQATTGLMLEHDQVSIPAGVPFVLSLGDSLASQRDQDSRLQLNIARDKYSAMSPALDAARGRAVNTPLGGMLAQYIRLLGRELPTLTEEDAHKLPQAIAAMVVACVAPSNDHMTVAREQIGATLKDKARRCILQNLRSHRLGADMLCRELGMSRSSLYRLLESEGGVAQYIQRLRLSESFAQLSDPANRKPIAVIADELGMIDSSSFSRAFRRQFGISPTDAREAAQAGLAPSIAQAHQNAWNGIGGLLSRL